LSQQDVSASHDDIEMLSRAGILDPKAVLVATASLCRTVPAEHWIRNGYQGLFGLGVLHVLAGVVFFFASNWALLTKWERLIPIFMIMSLTGVLGGLREGTLGGRLLLTVSTVLVGVFMAVFGQVYQTGADSWTLFANWAGLSVLWVFASRFRPLALVWVFIAQTAVLLYFDQVLEVSADWSCFVCALICLIALTADCLVSIGSARWFRRILSTNALCMSMLPMMKTDYFVMLGFALVLITGVSWRRQRVEDFYQVTLAAVLGICGMTILFFKYIAQASWGFFETSTFTGIFIMVLVGGSVSWLRSEWSARP
jgi:uncharacterized membrane protein